ncbi:thiamine phosphate synthase [Thermodesulfovibrio yellowstonii]|uniref:Thiamine-phosphate synthase n=1 Tax=Thermodesulfovibrio yellowstonii TaxID=28262 RepID=A0A9W6GHD8_9BACT|nr:thiamine phosphate synthase [Thermodesulfovibrio islandicus]GLI54190.1 thiamine-phosphate synthase [Thermodesulfovibrio islandicus]
MNFKLYLIGDRKLFSDEEAFLSAVDRALKAGVKAFQLREKDLTAKQYYYLAKKLREITKRNDAMLFINDRIDIALAVEADGVHLPQSGFPPRIVREVWKDRFLIGVSTHSIDEAKEASEWADFITFSPIFHTPSKAHYGEPQGVEKLKEVKESVKCKVFALGGIKLENVHELIPYSDGIALISGILAQRNIEGTVKKFKEILGENI